MRSSLLPEAWCLVVRILRERKIASGEKVCQYDEIMQNLRTVDFHLCQAVHYLMAAELDCPLSLERGWGFLQKHRGAMGNILQKLTGMTIVLEDDIVAYTNLGIAFRQVKMDIEEFY